MTVQIPLKRNNWVFNTGPWFRSLVSWEDEVKCLDTPILESSIIWEHLPFLLGDKPILRLLRCPSQPGNLEMISMILAAVIWDAEDFLFSEYCVRTWVVFYNITTEYNSTFVLLVLCLQFRWHMSINDAKWTVAPDVLASSIISFLLLTFVRFHAEIFSNFSHSLSTGDIAAGIFIAWSIGLNLCTKL